MFHIKSFAFEPNLAQINIYLLFLLSILILYYQINESLIYLSYFSYYTILR